MAIPNNILKWQLIWSNYLWELRYSSSKDCDFLRHPVIKRSPDRHSDKLSYRGAPLLKITNQTWVACPRIWWKRSALFPTSFSCLEINRNIEFILKVLTHEFFFQSTFLVPQKTSKICLKKMFSQKETLKNNFENTSGLSPILVGSRLLLLIGFP